MRARWMLRFVVCLLVLLSGSLALWAIRGGPSVAPEALLATRGDFWLRTVPGEIPIQGPLTIDRTLEPGWTGWFAGSCPGVLAWFYTARYRQYYVQIEYFGPRRAISSEEFAGLVGLLMGETEATLKSRE